MGFRRIAAGVVGLSGLLLGTSLQAAPIIEETFTGYLDNALISDSPAGPALGLTGDWTLVPDSNFYVNKTQVDDSAGTGKAVYDRPSGDNGTREATRATSADHLLFSNDGDLFYASFLIDPALANGRMTFELALTRLDGGGTPAFSFGIIDGQYTVGNGGIDVDLGDGTVTADEQLVLVRIEYGDADSGPDDSEVVTVWVDPVDESSAPVIDGVSTDFLNRGGGKITAVSIRGEQMAGQPAFFDDLRVGSSFDAVVPNPGATPTPTPGGTPLPTATPGPTPTPTVPPVAGLDRDEQKCVEKMNKAGGKVDKAQLKENERCLKDHQQGKLDGLTVEQCTTADRKGKVAKAEGKTVTDDEKFCTWLNPAPDFGYTGAAAVNEAAVEGPLDLIHAIFGNPLDDASLSTSASSKDTAKCQAEMLKRADKLEDTVLKELVKAKQKAIKEPTVNSAEKLETALVLVLSSNEKITKAQDKLVKSVDKKCESLGALPSVVFPGICADALLDNVEDCAIAAARCVACEKMSTFDGLDLDCDDLDDGEANGSCS